jgi:hypothetical protein
MDIDGPHQDLSTACIITQQYSFATFISLCLLYCKEKFGTHLRNFIFKILFYLLKTVEHGITNVRECMVLVLKNVMYEQN